MIDELKLIDNVDVLRESKIILYGAGIRGIETLGKLKELDIPVAYFCDGDPRKWGELIEGLEVLSLQELKKLDNFEDIAVIITTDQVQFIDQIVEDIAQLKLSTDNVFTLFALEVSLVRNKLASGLNGGHHNAIVDMNRDIYYASEINFYLNMRLRWVEKDSIMLVYSCPKAGTISLEKSLREINAFADRFHTFYGGDLFQNPLAKETIGKNGKNCLDILRSRNSVKIITTVREPVSRNLSLIFHLIWRYEFKLRDMPQDNLFLNSFTQILTSQKCEIYDSRHEPLNWFDNELKAVFGIDVYAHPFDRESGYSIIKKDNIEVLVMKLEKLNNLEQVISEFVGNPRFKLISANVGNEKTYKYLYKQVKESVKLPVDVLDYYYKDPRMSYFYSEDEIASFRKMWEKNIEINTVS